MSTTRYTPQQLLGDGATIEPCVHCPFCGSTYVHLQGIVFSACGGKPIEVTHSYSEDDPEIRINVNPAPRHAPVPQSSRRGAAMLVFDGECGHRFGLTFEQHKGQEFIHTCLLGRVPDDG